MHRFIELSHVIEEGMITYPGLPGPVIRDYLSRDASKAHYAEGTAFQIGKIEMVANTGTYIDAPFHRYSGGADLSGFELSAIANLNGLVLRADPEKRSIHQDLFINHNLNGKAVLVYTGWDKYWRTDQYFENHPFLTRDAAEFLSASEVALVGIDSLNIDDTEDGTRPAHTILLGSNIPIVEHMCNLDTLPESGFNFFAVPAPVKGMGSFPVRAFAIID